MLCLLVSLVIRVVEEYFRNGEERLQADEGGLARRSSRSERRWEQVVDNLRLKP